MGTIAGAFTKNDLQSVPVPLLFVRHHSTGTHLWALLADIIKKPITQLYFLCTSDGADREQAGPVGGQLVHLDLNRRRPVVFHFKTDRDIACWMVDVVWGASEDGPAAGTKPWSDWRFCVVSYTFVSLKTLRVLGGHELSAWEPVKRPKAAKRTTSEEDAGVKALRKMMKGKRARKAKSDGGPALKRGTG